MSPSDDAGSMPFGADQFQYAQPNATQATITPKTATKPSPCLRLLE